MRVKNLDLLLAMAIALGSLVWETRTSHHPQIIGILLALPQVFFLPGYTLVETLFHRHPLENVRRFVLSLGLSIALVILSGFILNKTPWGLSMLSWTIYLASMTIGLSLIAMLLRAGRRSTFIDSTTLAGLYATFRKHVIALSLLALAVALAVVAIMYSSYSVVHQRRPGFTQLWLLQANPHTRSCAVLIGVDSFEFTTMNYRLFVTARGALTTSWSSPIRLTPQKTWKVMRPLAISSPGTIEIQVQLYRDNKPGELYRYVHLTLYSTKDRHTQGWQCTS